MWFSYKVLDPQGNKLKARMQAGSRQEAIDRLKEENYLIVEVKEDLGLVSLPLFSRRELAIFSREVYFLLSNGMDLIDVFVFMEKKAKKKRQKEFFRQLVEDLYRGKDLGESLRKQNLPSFFVASINIAKESNSLAESFRILADHYEKQDKLRQSLKLALIYPGILCLSMFFMTQFISVYVMPIFEDLFQQRGLAMPWYTRALFSITGFIRGHALFLTALIAVGILLILKLKQGSGFKEKVYRILYKLPISATFVRTRLSMDFSGHLYLLLASGTDLLEGLSILAKSSQHSFDREVYRRIQEELVQGKTLWKILEEGDLFLESLPAILRTSDYGAPLVDVFEHTNRLYQEDYTNLCRRLNALFEPVILLVISVLVAFVVLSIASPMFDLMNQI